MCQLKFWLDAVNGYVAQCVHCGLYQVAYGTSLLTFTELQLQQFTTEIMQLATIGCPGGQEHVKAIILPTPEFGYQVILCHKELLELDKLLQNAQVEITTGALLALISNPG